MVSSKITRLANGWTDEELNGWPENNSRSKRLDGWTDGELNERLENNSSNKWTDGELNGRLENNPPRDV